MFGGFGLNLDTSNHISVEANDEEEVAAMDDAELEEAAENLAKEELERYVALRLDLAKYRKAGTEETGTPKNLVDLLLCADTRKWVLFEVKDKHNIAYRVLLRHLGFMVTSTFMERMFSIAKQVWNKASQSQSTARFEMRSVLRGGKKALGQLQAAGATTS